MSIDSNAAILHAPDLLADEYDPELGRRAVAATPERALIAAVIRNAFDEAREIVAGDHAPSTKAAIIADARAWLQDVTSENLPGTWGLAFCAEVLGTTPERIARRTPMAKVVGQTLVRARYRGTTVRVVVRRKKRRAA